MALILLPAKLLRGYWKALLVKGQRQVTRQAEEIAFESIYPEVQRKGVTLALVWQEGVNTGHGNFELCQFLPSLQPVERAPLLAEAPGA